MRIQQLPCIHDYVIRVGGLGRHDDNFFTICPLIILRRIPKSSMIDGCTAHSSYSNTVARLMFLLCPIMNSRLNSASMQCTAFSPPTTPRFVVSRLLASVEAIRQRFHKVQCHLFADRHSINNIYALVCNLHIHEIERLICRRVLVRMCLELMHD